MVVFVWIRWLGRKKMEKLFYEENGEFVPFVITEDGFLRFAAGMMLLERTK